MKTATSIVTFSLTSLSVICIAVGQTNTATPAPAVSSAPIPPTMTTPAAQVPAANAMDNFRRNQQTIQRMNAMRQMGRPPQLDAAAKAAAAKNISEGTAAKAAATNAPKPLTDERAAKQTADTKKPATETAASPTASATVAAASPKN